MSKEYKLKLRRVVRHSPQLNTAQEIVFRTTAHYGIIKKGNDALHVTLNLATTKHEIRKEDIPDISINLSHKKKKVAA